MSETIKNHKCDVCDGNQFTLNEGFYYCDECGTQLKQVIDLNLDEDFVEDLSRLEKKVIKKDKTEKKGRVSLASTNKNTHSISFYS